MMSKLKLGPIADDKPLKVQVESKVSPLLTQLG